ncbi:MAG: DUF3857 domain-containing protein [Bacteroidales bacterium]|nr:DUF3857 domain-containing protein [Bacteroidales bacterium]
MKKLTLLIISLLCVAAGYSQNENADAIYEKIKREYTLNNDGSMVFREFKQMKYLTHLSFNRLYGETFIVYNPRFQELVINEAYTIMADGSKVITPPNAFNEVLPRNAAQSATYNHLREMVVTHTGLEIGASVYFDYSIITKKDFWHALMGNVLIKESSPVREMEVIVRMPDNQQLNYQMFNSETKPEVVTKGSEQIFTWKFDNLSASSKEPFIGKYQAMTPRLIFSTAGNISDLAHWVARQDAFDYQLSDEIKSFIDKITAEKPDELKIIQSLQKEVAQSMAWGRAEPIYTGFVCRTPSEVWKSNGGSLLEKTVLLAAMLRHAGIDASPALAGPRSLFEPKASNLLLFEESIVIINTRNHGTVYLSATVVENQSLEYLFQNEVIMPLLKTGEITPIFPKSFPGEITFNGRFSIDTAMNLTGEIETSLQGSNNPFFSLSEAPGKLGSFISGGIIKKGENSVSITELSKEKSSATLAVEKTNPFREFSGYYQWELPFMNHGFESYRVNYLATSRTDSFMVPAGLDEKYEFTIDLPAGYEFVNPDASLEEKCAAGSVSINFSNDENQLMVTRVIQLTNTLVSPEDYESFRTMVNLWLEKNYKTIVFKKTE